MNTKTRTGWKVAGVCAIFLLLVVVTNAPPAYRAQERWAWERLDPGSGETLRGVWGMSSTDAFAVGDGGTILRFDGRSWRPQVSHTFENLSGIWGTSTTDVFAVGAHGTILHFDGSRWRPVAQNLAPDYALEAVWSPSSADVFVVGGLGETIPAAAEVGAGIVLQYDGTRWARERLPASCGRLSFVWGSSPNNVYAGGAGGPVLHFDGTSWTAVEQPPSGSVGGEFQTNAVWGTSAADIYLAGTQVHHRPSTSQYDPGSTTVVGVFLHNDGQGWSPYSKGIDTLLPLHPVWINSAADVYAIGSGPSLLHFDGAKWEILASLPSANLRAIWVMPSGDVIGVGSFGAILWGKRGG